MPKVKIRLGNVNCLKLRYIFVDAIPMGQRVRPTTLETIFLTVLGTRFLLVLAVLLLVGSGFDSLARECYSLFLELVNISSTSFRF